MSEWISVKERLPTEEDTNGQDFVIAIDIDDGVAKLWDWEIVARYSREFVCWMPLPPMPGEEKEK